jgi:sulfite exporter TauE/SafE
LAGSSHFVGVLVMLAFPTRAQAIAYLVTFGAGTIVSMAAFSWVMGVVATRWAARSVRVYRGLMSCCALAAMGVGCFWLATSWR